MGLNAVVWRCMVCFLYVWFAHVVFLSSYVYSDIINAVLIFVLVVAIIYSSSAMARVVMHIIILLGMAQNTSK